MTAVALTVTGVMASTPPAAATYPGANGLIVYNGPGVDLWTMHDDGSDQQLFIQEASNGAWSPDGQRIAFNRTMNEPGPGGVHSDIWVATADGTGEVRVTRNKGSDTSPTWSPNGRWLAFTSDRHGATEIFKTRSDGSHRATRLTMRLGERGDVAPDWSPEGGIIAYTSYRPSGPQLRTVPWSGGPSTALTRDFSFPSWSPDGDRILGMTNSVAFFGMVHVAADGSDRVEIGDGTAAWVGEGPVWSPEGDRIAFTQTTFDDWGLPSATIYVAPLDGSTGPVALVQHSGSSLAIGGGDWQPITS
jgi:Tol biopolymer transport system component